MSYTYRNRNTDQVVTFDEPHARLESLDNWESIDTPQGAWSDSMAAERAARERRSIEEAAAARADMVGYRSAAATAAAREAATSVEGTPAAHPTAAHHLPEHANTDTPVEVDAVGTNRGVLARAIEDQRAGRVQVGANRGKHVVGREAVMALAAEQEANHDPRGVLAKAHDDQVAGRTQVAADPAAHPSTPEGVAAKAAREAASFDATQGVLARAAAAAGQLTEAGAPSGVDPDDLDGEADNSDDDGGDAPVDPDADPDADEEEEEVVREVVPPKANASQAVWAKFAVEHKGASADEVKDLSRDELRDRYGN